MPQFGEDNQIFVATQSRYRRPRVASKSAKSAKVRSGLRVQSLRQGTRPPVMTHN